MLIEKLPDQSFCATFDNGQRVRARAVVVATGVQYRRPPLDRLADFEGAGIYYARPKWRRAIAKERKRFIVGGGNSAGQAAMFSQPLGELRARAGPRGVACRVDVELPLQPARRRSQDHN